MAKKRKVISDGHGREPVGQGFLGSFQACGIDGAQTRKTDPILETANRVAETLNADVLYYNGLLDRRYARNLIEMVLTRHRRPQVLLVMCTAGGDPDAAYLIAKCLQWNYEQFTLLVAGYCKSGGTLVAIGAHDLVFSDYGELGPLDIQLPKKDEIGGQESGSATRSALDSIVVQAFSAFETFFLDLIDKSEGQITLQTAAKIASDLATGLLVPISAQINPVYVGEVARALNIANRYGRMLDRRSQNLKPGGLDLLISDYPSHGFVIDGHEAQNIFNRVSFSDDGPIAELAWDVRNAVMSPIGFDRPPVFAFLSDEIGKEHSAKEQSHDNEQTGEGGSATAPETQEAKLISTSKEDLEPNQRGKSGRRTPHGSPRAVEN